MKILKSKIKTDEEGFNNLPNRKMIKKALKGVDCTPVDIDMDYWKNTDDTLVLLIDDTLTALRIGKFAQNFAVDEFHYQKTDGGSYIVRLWWD